jgi:pimeloyl-ACP methyl ester carboxylesterase
MDLAAAYPQDVGAVVLLDVPAPNATITQADVGGPWDAPGNPEFVDAVEAEHRLANHPPAIRPIPLRVVTASFGQSSVKDQSFWTKLSPKSDSVLLEGGHVIYEDDAQGSIDQILEAIRSV